MESVSQITAREHDEREDRTCASFGAKSRATLARANNNRRTATQRDPGRLQSMKILIGVDRSPASQYVVDEAVVRPWPSDTIFSVITIVDEYGFARFPALLRDAKHDGATLVKTAADKLSDAGHKVSTEVFLASPRTGISKYAKQWEADLIMLGSHGQGALARFLLGSVAQTTVRTAPCSIEIVRPNSSGLQSSAHSMRVLLATDGSEFSVAAAQSIAARPWPHGTQFKILCVEELPIPEYPATAPTPYPAYPLSLLEELLDCAADHAKESVEEARGVLVAAGLTPLENSPAPLGNPRALILDQAKGWGADLIVLGSHGRRGMDRIVLGSVSESVAMYAHCSVEVIRPRKPQ
jgi:nucleotide-binding universal stress UspA family protein